MLTDRQLLILKVIVDEFIESAQPVGSRHIAKKNYLSFSPATIRNEMADLEDLGFLEKTHSSSGRIPSEKGYRYYVDHIMSPLKLTREEINQIHQSFSNSIVEMEKVLQNSAVIVSELTKYTTLVLGPQVFDAKLKQIQIVPLSKHSAIAILITDTGHVEHRTFIIPEDLDHSDLEKTVNILNEKLAGSPIISLQQMIETEVRELLLKYTRNAKQSYEILKKALLSEQPTNLIVSGKANILMQPEFNDLNKARTLFTMMENEEDLAPLLQNNKEGINIYIGQENKVEAMNNCTLITSTYSVNGNQVGTIALLGPTRMDYAKAVSILNFWSTTMSETLKKWFNE